MYSVCTARRNVRRNDSPTNPLCCWLALHLHPRFVCFLHTDTLTHTCTPNPFTPTDDFQNPTPTQIHLPTLLVANKSDLDPDPDDVRVLEELLGVRFPAVAVSAETGAGSGKIGPLLFDGLGIVRVYTKIPGRPADKKRPYAVRRGDTVLDVARLVHKEIAESLKFARVWGSGQFDGQQVGADHPMADEDIIELHG